VQVRSGSAVSEFVSEMNDDGLDKLRDAFWMLVLNRVLSVMAFHEKAGRSQVGSFVFSLDRFFLFPPSSHCRHASIRTLEERLVRSVQIGRSRYSRCCHLIGALWFCSSRVEHWARP
jgi:hypothetical protein